MEGWGTSGTGGVREVVRETAIEGYGNRMLNTQVTVNSLAHLSPPQHEANLLRGMVRYDSCCYGSTLHGGDSVEVKTRLSLDSIPR